MDPSMKTIIILITSALNLFSQTSADCNGEKGRCDSSFSFNQGANVVDSTDMIIRFCREMGTIITCYDNIANCPNVKYGGGQKELYKYRCDTHFEAFKKYGACITQNEQGYIGQCNVPDTVLKSAFSTSDAEGCRKLDDYVSCVATKTSEKCGGSDAGEYFRGHEVISVKAKILDPSSKQCPNFDYPSSASNNAGLSSAMVMAACIIALYTFQQQ